LKRLKHLIPKAFKSKVKKIFYIIDLALVKAFLCFRPLSKFYYFMFSNSFSRECRSVMEGRRKYYSDLMQNDEFSSLLRRNIHRLEKGLSMKERREVFAEDYIHETVVALSRHKDRKLQSYTEVKWFFDVLDQYFLVVKKTGIISKSWDVYESIKSSSLYVKTQQDKFVRFVPYRRKEVCSLRVSPSDFLELCKRRRSVRWYEDKVVDESILRQAVEAAKMSPSACNRQPFRMLAFTGDQASRVASVAMGTAGYASNIKNLVVLIGRLDLYPEERDRHVIYIDASLFAMSFMLCIETLGLASCPINWPDIEAKELELEAMLGLKAYERPVMMISFGYADPEGFIPFSQKKSYEDLVVYSPPIAD
jgi:nitroreductase